MPGTKNVLWPVKKIVRQKEHFSDPSLADLINRIMRGDHAATICGLPEAAQSFVISTIFDVTQRNVLLIKATRKEAEEAFRDLSFFLGEENVCYYPPWDFQFTDEVALYQKSLSAQRISVLLRLLSGKPIVLVIPLEALMQKVIPIAVFGDYIETVSTGVTFEREHFIEKLREGGYKRVPLVEAGGEFSARGHIVDIFPPAVSQPFRIEFIGDEIEIIRSFNPLNQRSLTSVSEFILPPALELILSDQTKENALKNLRERSNEINLPRTKREYLADMIETESSALAALQYLPLFYMNCDDSEGLDTLFDYIPAKSLIVFDEFQSLEKNEEQLGRMIDKHLQKAETEEKFYLEKESFYLKYEEIFERSKKYQTLFIQELNYEVTADSTIRFQVSKHVGLRQELTFLERERALLKPLADKIKQWIETGNLVIFLCAEGEQKRMFRLLEEYSLPITQSPQLSLSDLYAHNFEGELIVKTGKISEGFFYPGLHLVVVSEEEVFGKKVKRPRKTRQTREGYFLKSFGELKEGDFVVHVDHGVGMYKGLCRLAVGNIENDFLLMEYLGSDKLYIPVEHLDQIQRYIGPEGYHPSLDKLGGSSWETVKNKVKKSVRKIAEELVGLYAAREVMDGYEFSAPDRYYEEFSSSFEYEETPDQAKAIEDVEQDMSTAKPMDRLVCGDAGFGKTEVALRASFRCIMDEKQVAFLVPTTILAEQHYQTFTRRFAKYPVRIEVLNRFKTKALQKKIVEDINGGGIDIIIGTHRLLQKDVLFKNLGLVIIDEEQYFGVSHKEKLKKLRTMVDVLTLTATPIPRTLQLSLIGIRDLSVIDTPPQDRQAARIIVSEFDDDIVIEAIKHELLRNGQIFFLHDRVQSIYNMARYVERLVPEAKVGIAHGQMKPSELEEIMVSFLQKKINVLVCTTIISSGIDISAANTMIINRADKFGLSQLYQLRGRVGRSNEEAYAYLLIPKGRILSKDARRRLRVAQEFTDPGSGFKVALHDLEIRGGGNFLGISQSGHVSAVGYELYTELMEKTIKELKGEGVATDDIHPEIQFGLPAFIPDDFIEDMTTRLITYKRISMAGSEDILHDLKEELYDCYGTIPPQVDNLLDIIHIRNLLKSIQGEKIKYDGRSMVITFNKSSSLDPFVILKLSQKTLKGLRFTPSHELIIPMEGLQGKQVFEKAEKLLQELLLCS